MIQIEPFVTNDTFQAAFIATNSKRLPELRAPSLFTRTVQFVFEDGDLAKELAQRYLRDENQIRSVFSQYQALKEKVFALKPYTKGSLQ